MPETNSLRLIRVKDPNEALGLAVRLLAGVAPFRDMPLGLSMGALVEAIESETYAFAAEPGKAVGFAAWRPCRAEAAEDWMFGRGATLAPQVTEGADAAIILAAQAQRKEVARFLHRSLRDGPLADCPLFYYVRDYGKGSDRRTRFVRLRRPSGPVAIERAQP